MRNRSRAIRPSTEANWHHAACMSFDHRMSSTTTHAPGFNRGANCAHCASKADPSWCPSRNTRSKCRSEARSNGRVSRMAPPGALYRPRAPPGGGGPRSVQPSPDFLRGRHNGIDHGRPRAPCSRPQPPSRSPTRGCPPGHRAVQRAAPGQRPHSHFAFRRSDDAVDSNAPTVVDGSCPTALSPPRNPGFR